MSVYNCILFVTRAYCKVSAALQIGVVYVSKLEPEPSEACVPRLNVIWFDHDVESFEQFWDIQKTLKVGFFVGKLALPSLEWCYMIYLFVGLQCTCWLLTFLGCDAKGKGNVQGPRIGNIFSWWVKWRFLQTYFVVCSRFHFMPHIVDTIYTWDMYIWRCIILYDTSFHYIHRITSPSVPSTNLKATSPLDVIRQLEDRDIAPTGRGPIALQWHHLEVLVWYVSPWKISGGTPPCLSMQVGFIWYILLSYYRYSSYYYYIINDFGIASGKNFEGSRRMILEQFANGFPSLACNPHVSLLKVLFLPQLLFPAAIGCCWFSELFCYAPPTGQVVSLPRCRWHWVSRLLRCCLMCFQDKPSVKLLAGRGAPTMER